MACESCKVVVKDALEELDISPVKVELGEVETTKEISDDDKRLLNKKIKKVGLELLEKKQGVLIVKIRKVIIEYVYKSDEKPNIKFSVLLSEKLNHSYTYLANFFSEVEATTIEQFIIALKIERIKSNNLKISLFVLQNLRKNSIERANILLLLQCIYDAHCTLLK